MQGIDKLYICSAAHFLNTHYLPTAYNHFLSKFPNLFGVRVTLIFHFALLLYKDLLNFISSETFFYKVLYSIAKCYQISPKKCSSSFYTVGNKRVFTMIIICNSQTDVQQYPYCFTVIVITLGTLVEYQYFLNCTKLIDSHRYKCYLRFKCKISAFTTNDFSQQSFNF